MGTLVKSLCLLLSIHTIFANPITSVETYKASDPYRLDTNVKPSRYDIVLKVQPDFGTTKKFTGSVDIHLTPSEDVNTIKLHSANITYEKKNILINDKPTENYSENSTLQMITITLAQSLKKGTNNKLSIIDFTATLHEDMYGFYISSYKNKLNKIEWVATTQFQATYARRAFPCFDEPNFKAVFNMKIQRPKEYSTLFNTELIQTNNVTGTELQEDIYKETPSMSTYLVAFIVSKFKPYELATSSPTYNVWSREEALPTAKYSYEVGKNILSALNNYTNMLYNTIGIQKMDQVAIPDFAAGAMENWGLVTYRETGLLWDEDESTAINKQRVASVIAHEFSHMWFGDLVTLDWWSVTWLNEGFARYFQYFIPAVVEDKWELEKQFVIEQLQVVFGSDAIEKAPAMTSDASSPSEISNKFDSISYNKGASIIRMLTHVLGDKFVTAIRKYLENNKYQNTVPKDLFDALGKEFDRKDLPNNVTFETIMSGWTTKSGYPVVTVTQNENNVVLTQKRFLLNSEAENKDTWDIPITYATSKNKNFDDTAVKQWFVSTEKSITLQNALKDSTWIIVNPQETGYYRVNYCQSLWKALQTALNANAFDKIHVINRAQIVDDSLNLARAGLLPYGTALDTTNYLQEETEYFPWYSAYNAFSFLRRRVGDEGELAAFLKRHILTLMNKVYKSVSFDINKNTGHVETLKTSQTLQWACNLGHEECVKKATELFNGYKDKQTPINPNIRSTVYCTALRNSPDRANWDYLWQKYQETKLATEQNIIMSALGCTKIKAVLTEYLEKSITANSGIRRQDANTVFTAVLSGNPDGFKTALEFLKSKITTIAIYYDGLNAISKLLTSVADTLTTEQQVKEFEDFVNANKAILQDAAKKAEGAIESARANIKWVESNTADLTSWFKATYEGSSAASVTLSFTLVVAALVTVALNML